MVLIADICAQVCEHANSPLQQDSSNYITCHDYWLDHHHFEHVLATLAQEISVEDSSSKQDPLLQFIALAIQSALIHLYKGAIDHGKKVTGMEAVVKDSTEKCLQAALKIANIIQSIPISESSPVSNMVGFLLETDVVRSTRSSPGLSIALQKLLPTF
jgi:hypothetical protein